MLLDAHEWLSPLERLVVSRLAESEALVCSPDVRRKDPKAADRVDQTVRDFVSRLCRRGIGVRFGLFMNSTALERFSGLLDGDETLMRDAVRQVEGLLNHADQFVIPLNTTFGEPLPPVGRRVVLHTSRQRVRPSAYRTGTSYPRNDVRFLTVGSNTHTQLVPLTFELFHSVLEIEGGLHLASLPRAIVAMLDSTRGRLAGWIVRDGEALDRAEIHMGGSDQVVLWEMGQFTVKSRDVR